MMPINALRSVFLRWNSSFLFMVVAVLAWAGPALADVAVPGAGPNPCNVEDQQRPGEVCEFCQGHEQECLERHAQPPWHRRCYAGPGPQPAQLFCSGPPTTILPHRGGCASCAVGAGSWYGGALALLAVAGGALWLGRRRRAR